MKSKKSKILIILIIAGIIIIFLLKTGYLVAPKLLYCQGVAIDYLTILSDGLILSEVREQEYKDLPYIQFFFEIDEDADDYQMEEALYKAWSILRKHMKKNNRLANDNVDVVVFNYNYNYGAGIRNFDLEGRKSNNKWMIYNTEFKQWEDLKKYTDLQGMVGCKINSDVNIDKAYAALFDSLKYMYIKVGEGDTDKQENEMKLKEVFADVDIDFSKYQRIHTNFGIGKK